MNKRYKGEVVWFNPKPEFGYGFISWGEGQEDMFLHFSDIVCEGYKTVKKGDIVEFGVGENNSGRPKAIEVVVVNE